MYGTMYNSMQYVIFSVTMSTHGCIFIPILQVVIMKVSLSLETNFHSIKP